MTMLRACAFALVSALATVPVSARAVDANARVVELRSDCTGVSNCFTSTSALTDWLWGGGPGGRANPPSSSDRVVVLAGPGTFGRFDCDGSAATQGYVSVIGAGREFTRLESNDGASGFGGTFYCNGGINAYNCKELNFQDLTAYGSHTGVFWIGGGSSSWSDVDVVAGGPGAVTACEATTGNSLAWYDIDGDGGAAKHYFFGSRVISRGVVPNNGIDWVVAVDSASIGEIWFYGGDILAEPASSAAYKRATGVRLGKGVFEAFGTSIRTRVGAATTATFSNGFEGVDTQAPSQQAKFHIHGGIIAVDASGSATQVHVRGVRGSGHVHAVDTAFVVKPGGTGTATRLVGNATFEAPFLWPGGSSPPNVTSVHGADLFVDTAAGPSQNEAHLMVYDTQCTGAGGPWRDMAENACRQ